MNIKNKKVYYCDHCKKHSLRSLEKHESICTMNVNRVCRLCGRKEPLVDMVNKYKGVNPANAMDIMDDVNDCPVCTLAVIRIAKLNKFPNNIVGGFDFKKELDKWWEYKNKEDYMAEMQQL